MFSLFHKVRYWGLKGILNHFGGKIHSHRLSRFFSKNLSKYPVSSPQRGITIIAPFREKYSLCKSARDLLSALHHAKIPYQTFDLSDSDSAPNPQITPLLTPPSLFRLSKYSHILDFASSPLPISLPSSLSLCHIVFWEFDTGLLEYYPATTSGASIITFSDYNANLARRLLPPSIPVYKILYPFLFIPIAFSIRETRKKFGLNESDFIVFNNFDFNSSFFRKNPMGALQAFASAFANTNNAHLLFKTNHAQNHSSQKNSILSFAKELGVASRVHIIDEYLSQNEIYALTASANVYLALHRGEGFGLGIAEALYLGIPSIVTNYSATTEFCTPNTAILINAPLKSIPQGSIDNPAYAAVSSAPEPDIQEAAAALRHLYDDPALRNKLSAAASSFMKSYFSNENFAKSVQMFLNSSP